jgi:hypothetical protein
MSYSSRQEANIISYYTKRGVTEESLNRIGTKLSAQWGINATWASFNRVQAATFEAEADKLIASDTPVSAPTIDRQAARVAQIIGAASPRATGRCHYCGQSLNRHGHCDECI